MEADNNSGAERYELTYAYLTPVELVVSPAGQPDAPFSVFTQQGKLEPFLPMPQDEDLANRRDRILTLNGYFLHALDKVELRKVLGSELDFTPDQLKKIVDAVQSGVDYISIQKGPEAMLAIKKRAVDPSRYEAKLAKMLPGLKNLLGMVNGELSVEEFLEILSKKI